eukprot:275222-Amorphochlora_amoeboformis.AAC.2
MWRDFGVIFGIRFELQLGGWGLWWHATTAERPFCGDPGYFSKRLAFPLIHKEQFYYKIFEKKRMG